MLRYWGYLLEINLGILIPYYLICYFKFPLFWQFHINILMIAIGIDILLALFGLKHLEKNQIIIIDRLGNLFSEKNTPGFHFILPILESLKPVYIGDKAIKKINREKIYTTKLNSENFITIDGSEVILDIIIDWRVEEPHHFVYTENNIECIIKKVVYDKIQEIIRKNTQREIISPDKPLYHDLFSNPSNFMYDITITGIKIYRICCRIIQENAKQIISPRRIKLIKLERINPLTSELIPLYIDIAVFWHIQEQPKLIYEIIDIEILLRENIYNIVLEAFGQVRLEDILANNCNDTERYKTDSSVRVIA